MDFPEDIYSNRILEVVATMPDLARLALPDGTAMRHSKLCGSKVTVDLMIDGDQITGYGHEVEACLLGQTAATVMARNAIGLRRKDIEKVRDQMNKMLKENGEPPTGIWTDLEVLYPVRDYKPRHTSMVLVFEAALGAFDDALAKQGAEAAS